jgi:hypothetical protein
LRRFREQITDRRHDRPVADTVWTRVVDPDRPDTAWAADHTCGPTVAVGLDLTAALDLDG